MSDALRRWLVRPNLFSVSKDGRKLERLEKAAGTAATMGAYIKMSSPEGPSATLSSKIHLKGDYEKDLLTRSSDKSSVEKPLTTRTQRSLSRPTAYNAMDEGKPESSRSSAEGQLGPLPSKVQQKGDYDKNSRKSIDKKEVQVQGLILETKADVQKELVAKRALLSYSDSESDVFQQFQPKKRAIKNKKELVAKRALLSYSDSESDVFQQFQPKKRAIKKKKELVAKRALLSYSDSESDAFQHMNQAVKKEKGTVANRALLSCSDSESDDSQLKNQAANIKKGSTKSRRCPEKRCKKMFKTPEEVWTHLGTEHPRSTYKICWHPKCNLKFYENITNHHRLAHVKLEHICPFEKCGRRFQNNAIVTTHINKFHQRRVGYWEPEDKNNESSYFDVEDNYAELLERKFNELGIPDKSELINRGRFIIGYDRAKYHSPKWVYEMITAGTLSGVEEEDDDEHAPAFRQYIPMGIMQPTVESIKSNGHHCGHLVPRFHHKKYKESFEKTFEMINITPMLSSFNAGVWSSAELHSRRLTEYWENVSVLAGPIFCKETPALISAGWKDIYIPKSFWKVIILERNGEQPEVQSFMFPHDEKAQGIYNFRTTIENIEKESGLQLLRNLRKTWKYSWDNIDVSKCNFCFKAFTTEQLEKHDCAVKKSSHHCIFCNKTIKDYIKFCIHMRSHTGEKPFSCNICEKCFPSKTTLKQHELRHEDGEKHVCPNCNKSCLTEGMLQDHMQKHKVKSHICAICNKAFLKQAGLKMHMRSHTGERPHKCQFCSKSFISKGDLTMHIRIHTGERPHKCQLCSSAFPKATHLKRHMQTHTKEQSYQCTFCDKLYAYKDTLRRHVKQSHGGNLVN